LKPVDIQTKISRWWIESLGAFAAISLLTCVIVQWRDFQGSNPDKKVALFYLGLILLPAFITVFTSIAGRFWINFAIGLWFLFFEIIAGGGNPGLLLLGLTLAATPFLRMAFRAASPARDAAQEK
jgi:hypothetical protein